MPAADGKSYLTDVATAETLLRLVQSVPSPKAEPIKLWLAKVGYERMQESPTPPARSPALARPGRKQGRSAQMDRAAHDRTGKRATNSPITGTHDIKKGDEFAILNQPDPSGMVRRERPGSQADQGLKTENLRDHMSEAELIFHRPGRALHPPDRRERVGHRHGGKQSRRQNRWTHRQKSSSWNWRPKPARRSSPARNYLPPPSAPKKLQ